MKKGITAVAAIVGIVVIAYLIYENVNKNKKIKELEEDKLKLLLASLRNNSNLSDEIIQQIEKMIIKFETIDKRVSNELVQALQLLQIGQVENAIEDLVKIIEHLLEEHHKEDANFKKWLGKANKTLHKHLEFCKKEKKITEIEYQFFIAIKTIRNKEDHTLDLKLDKYLNASGLITAIGGIIKLTELAYPNNRLS